MNDEVRKRKERVAIGVVISILLAIVVLSIWTLLSS